MDKNRALAAFAALSQSSRLDAFRLLIKAGRTGMAAGEVSGAPGVKHNTLSANLSPLFQAGLVRPNREGRSTRSVDGVHGLREMLASRT